MKSEIRKPKWSRDPQHATLILIELDRKLETPDPINLLIKPKHLYDFTHRILKIPLMAKKKHLMSFYFILKMQGIGIWRSIAYRKSRLLESYLWHKTASDAPVIELGECRVPLHYHYSQVHSDWFGWLSLWHIKPCKLFNDKFCS